MNLLPLPLPLPLLFLLLVLPETTSLSAARCVLFPLRPLFPTSPSVPPPPLRSTCAMVHTGTILRVSVRLSDVCFLFFSLVFLNSHIQVHAAATHSVQPRDYPGFDLPESHSASVVWKMSSIKVPLFPSPPSATLSFHSFHKTNLWKKCIRLKDRKEKKPSVYKSAISYSKGLM